MACGREFSRSKVHLENYDKNDKIWTFHFCCGCGWSSDISISQECYLLAFNEDFEIDSFEDPNNFYRPPPDRYAEIIITNDGDIRKKLWIKGDLQK